ncbi:hypothetical protein [Xanthomonas graminis]|uniref:hypothetical protein n=1 Tax=Xanthomonas graminis TaxID=3390026 RepID=UPI001F239ED3|nr:hypothetical protein [Xanthomonas translucens]
MLLILPGLAAAAATAKADCMIPAEVDPEHHRAFARCRRRSAPSSRARTRAATSPAKNPTMPRAAASWKRRWRSSATATKRVGPGCARSSGRILRAMLGWIAMAKTWVAICRNGGWLSELRRWSCRG